MSTPNRALLSIISTVAQVRWVSSEKAAASGSSISATCRASRMSSWSLSSFPGITVLVFRGYHLCSCIHIYIYMYTHTCVRVRMCTNVYIYICSTCMCVYISIHFAFQMEGHGGAVPGLRSKASSKGVCSCLSTRMFRLRELSRSVRVQGFSIGK